MSGLWCLVSGLWCLVSGVWCLVSGLWSLVSGLRFVVADQTEQEVKACLVHWEEQQCLVHWNVPICLLLILSFIFHSVLLIKRLFARLPACLPVSLSSAVIHFISLTVSQSVCVSVLLPV